MKNRSVRVAIRHDMKDKAGEEQKKLTGSGWENCQLTVDQLMNHIKQGFPFAHQFEQGRRSTASFLGAEILIADIDHGFSLSKALEHPFIKSYATFIYTTPSHTEIEHRFRIVFVLERQVFEGRFYEALYQTLMLDIPTDPNVKSCAQFFFGNSQAKFYWIGMSLPDIQISKMIGKGLEKQISVLSPNVARKLTSNINVKVKNKGLQSIDRLPYGTSIHCPFGTHDDKNPSAFIKINADGIRGVECKACGETAWTEKSAYNDGGIGYFHRKVLEYAGQSNTHFQFQGMALQFPELESSLAKFNYHISDTDKFLLAQIIPGINLIKSAKGTGKTHALGKLVETSKSPEFRKMHGLQDEKVILIGHRQSLIRESARKLGLECYLDTGDFDTHLASCEAPPNGGKTQKPQYYAICLDSLHSRVKLHNEKYGIVIIDESEQVFSHFFSEHMEHPTRNFDVLSSLIKRAKFVYCLDADLDTITMSGVLACLSYSKDDRERLQEANDTGHHKKVYSHLNTYLPPERQLNLYESRNHLLDDLRKDIKSGKRCYITSNNKKFIQGQYEAFRQVFSEKKFKLVVSAIGDDQENRSFLKNIKSEILNYDAVWSSPTIGTGIDITFPNQERKIDCVYGFFDGGINTHFDIDQQLGRVRAPGEVKVWVSPARSKLPTDRQAILEELLYGKRIKGLSYYLDHNGAHSAAGDHPFLDLLTEVLMIRRKSMRDLRRNFIKHKNSNGWKVVEIVPISQAKKDGSVVGKAGRRQSRNATVVRILSAPDISFRESIKLGEAKEKGAPLTDVEKASVERYWIKKFYHQDITKALIEFDNYGKTRDKIERLELVINPTLKLQEYAKIPSELALLAGFNDPDVAIKSINKAVFLREALALAGIYEPKKNCLLPLTTYGTFSLKNFVSYIDSNRERLARLFEKEVNAHLFERPTSQVGALLRLIGLNQVLVKANKGGNPGGASYRIEPKTYQTMMDIVTMREKKRIEEEKHRKPDLLKGAA